MLSEILGFLDNLDVGKKSGKFRVNLNKNRIRSISAYSSNSIFYFPMIVSDQLTPEEATMIMRMSERMNASFVIACINLMPFHRIKADDKASIEEYLSQFHQNLGFDKDISGSAMQKFLGWTDSLQESYHPDELKQVQDFLMECWEKSKRDNMDFVKLVSESVSLHDMYDIDPIDPKTRIMQEQYFKTMEELDTWGFIGEATDDMFDDWTEEDLEDDEDYEDLDDEDWDEDDIDPDDYPEDAIDELLGEAAMKAKKRNSLPDDAFGLPSQRKFPLNDKKHVRLAIQMFKHCPEKDRKTLAGNIKKAMTKYNLDIDIGKDSAIYKYMQECFASELSEGVTSAAATPRDIRIRNGCCSVAAKYLKDDEDAETIDDCTAIKDCAICEGTLKNLAQDLPMIFSNMTSKPMKDGNWEKLEKNYEKMIKSAKDMERINYIRRDLRNGVTSMTKLLDKMEGVQAGDLNNPNVAKMMKSGNTPKKLKAHIKWCKETAPKLLNDRAKEIRASKSVNESSVGEAVSSIKFALESVSENKILSCKNLTKLKTLENKLLKLKNRYVKYLNRYKKKYNENKKKGTKSKLSIRFNNMTISNPKAFMLKFGEYIKIINKRLKLVEKRRAQLHSQKGDVVMTKDWKDDKKVNETTELGDLGQMDFEAVDYCITAADQQLTAPDSQVFELVDEEDEETLDEASIPRHGVEYDYGYKDAQNRYISQARDASRKADRMADRLNAAEQRNRRYEQLTKQARQQAADERKRATDAEKAGAQAQRENERLQKQLADQQKTRAQQRNERNANQPSGFTFDRSRPQSDINPYLAADAKHTEFHTFDRQVFTDMDMKKANDAIPTFAKATIGFVIDDTEEVISRDVLVGIKSYIHRAPSRELIDDVYNCIINKRKFLKFVKFITGEERSLSDLLFGIRELRSDALDGKKGAGQWRSAFKRRRRWAKMSIPYLMKEYTPNGTVVMTMNEVDFIKSEYGIDVMSPDHVKMIMDADFLLAFVVMDQANETVHVVYDGQGQNFQTYTYAQLERESNAVQNDRMLRSLYQAFSR